MNSPWAPSIELIPITVESENGSNIEQCLSRYYSVGLCRRNVHQDFDHSMKLRFQNSSCLWTPYWLKQWFQSAPNRLFSVHGEIRGRIAFDRPSQKQEFTPTKSFKTATHCTRKLSANLSLGQCVTIEGILAAVMADRRQSFLWSRHAHWEVYEGHFEITVSVNMESINMKSSGNRVSQNDRSLDVRFFSKGQHYNTDWGAAAYYCYFLKQMPSPQQLVHLVMAN
jgi:hypothetical protein